MRSARSALLQYEAEAIACTEMTCTREYEQKCTNQDPGVQTPLDLRLSWGCVFGCRRILLELAMAQNGTLHASAFLYIIGASAHTPARCQRLLQLNTGNGSLVHRFVLLVAVEPGRAVAALGGDKLVEHIPCHTLHVVVVVAENLNGFACRT